MLALKMKYPWRAMRRVFGDRSLCRCMIIESFGQFRAIRALRIHIAHRVECNKTHHFTYVISSPCVPAHTDTHTWTTFVIGCVGAVRINAATLQQLKFQSHTPHTHAQTMAHTFRFLCGWRSSGKTLVFIAAAAAAASSAASWSYERWQKTR